VKAGDTSPPAADLLVDKDATPQFKRKFTWAIDKSVDKTLVRQIGGTATFNYTVKANPASSTNQDWKVTGTIDVFNPNNFAVPGVNIAHGDLPDGRQPEHGHCDVQEQHPVDERGRRGSVAGFADGDAGDSRLRRDDAVTIQRVHVESRVVRRRSDEAGDPEERLRPVQQSGRLRSF
jgi:hypothetical protein